MATRLRSWPDIVARVWQTLCLCLLPRHDHKHSLTIKQESDVRAAAARLPGGFVDAGDILDLLRMGM